MLTKRDVDGAEPRAARYELWDGRNGLSGFGLRVTPQGVKTWVLLYRAGRRKRRLTLGGYPALTVQEARELARRKLADVLGGADPAALKTAAREAPTVAALAEAYMERHARPHKKTWKSDEARLRLHIAPALGQRPVAEVTAADVAQLHHEIGTRQAKRLAGGHARRLARGCYLQIEHGPGVIELSTSRPSSRARHAMLKATQAGLSSCAMAVFMWMRTGPVAPAAAGTVV